MISTANVNFYRVRQAHYEELVCYMRFLVGSRDWYRRLRDTPPESLTDIQSAARYFYLQKNTFGGRVAHQNFAIHVLQRPNFSLGRLSEIIERTHERLDRVQIESRPYQAIIDRYDRVTTFFYIDPPYYGVKGLHRFDFTHPQFEELAELLRSIKGKLLLSINDYPEIRRQFSRFHLSNIATSYSVQKHAGRRYEELLIRNCHAPVPEQKKGRTKGPAG